LETVKKIVDYGTCSFSIDEVFMNFKVYTKDQCPYCDKVKTVLKLTKIDHVVYTLEDDFTREEFYSKFGEGSTFPQVIVNETKIGGCLETVKYLREKNLI